MINYALIHFFLSLIHGCAGKFHVWDRFFKIVSVRWGSILENGTVAKSATSTPPPPRLGLEKIGSEMKTCLVWAGLITVLRTFYSHIYLAIQRDFEARLNLVQCWNLLLKKVLEHRRAARKCHEAVRLGRMLK